MTESTSGVENETGFFSLADLAGVSTDDISTLLSRVAPTGIYHVLVESVEGKQGEPKDGKPGLIRFTYKYKVLEAKLTDKNIDASSFAGRILTESYTIWPNSWQEAIGLLKGRYQKVGLPNAGVIGGVPNMEPGWLDGAVEKEIDIQVRQGTKNGEPVAYYDWMKPDPKAQAEREAALRESLTEGE